MMEKRIPTLASCEHIYIKWPNVLYLYKEMKKVEIAVVVHVLTIKNNASFNFLDINLKNDIIIKRMKFTTSTPIPQWHRLVDFSLISLLVQGEVTSKPSESRAFSKSQGLTIEISLLEGINLIANT